MISLNCLCILMQRYNNNKVFRLDLLCSVKPATHRFHGKCMLDRAEQIWQSLIKRIKVFSGNPKVRLPYSWTGSFNGSVHPLSHLCVYSAAGCHLSSRNGVVVLDFENPQFNAAKGSIYE